MKTNLKFLWYKDIIDYRILTFLSMQSYLLWINSVKYLINFFTENNAHEFILFLKEIVKRCYKTIFDFLNKTENKKEVINLFQVQNYKKYFKNYLNEKQIYHENMVKELMQQLLSIFWKLCRHKFMSLCFSFIKKLV